MRVNLRRKARNTDGQARSDPADDFSPEIWEFVARAVAAAGRGDAIGHRDSLLALEGAFPGSPAPARYLWYLLRLEVRISLERMPNQADIALVIDQQLDRIARIVITDRSTLEAVLLAVFELPRDPKIAIAGGRVVVLGTAIVGALTQPNQEALDTMKAQVERWYPRFIEAISSAQA